ncbi:glycosyltransferase [Streptomyces anulatus]|uniref:glycosyltransferase family 2 protein n=1 Tax=Streptomyces anulatus TaxID=1892 RepID=UPI0033FF0471
MRNHGLSVVTPTFGNPDLVDAMLESCVAAGKRIDVPWEHIVVDSTPDPEEAELIRRSCGRHGASYHRRVTAVGPKRNVGINHAQYSIVLFIDSDCQATHDLFVEHLKGHEKENVAGVAGPTEMTGSDAAFVWQVVRKAKQYNHCYEWPRRYSVMGWSTTSNLSIRRDVLREVDGFDEFPLTIQGADDVDLGVRISMAGYTIISRETAVVRHSRAPMVRVRQVASRVFTYGRADGWLCKKHPQLTTYYANPFVLVASAFVIGGLLRGRAPRVARVAGPGAALFLLARETLSRHERGSGVKGLKEDAVCSLVDLCFDAGEVHAALSQLEPSGLVRRFRYVQREWFQPREIEDQEARFVASPRNQEERNENPGNR